jgi:hypothetical protein
VPFVPQTTIDREEPSRLPGNVKRFSLAVLAGLALVASVAGLAWDIRLIVAQDPTVWGQAIQASATIILLVVTGTYAFLTFRLVRAQERAPSQAAYVSAATKVLGFLGQRMTDLYDVGRVFPLKETASIKVIKNALERTQSWRLLSAELRGAAGVLPPPILQQALETSSSISMGADVADAVARCSRLEE